MPAQGDDTVADGDSNMGCVDARVEGELVDYPLLQIKVIRRPHRPLLWMKLSRGPDSRALICLKPMFGSHARSPGRNDGSVGGGAPASASVHRAGGRIGFPKVGGRLCERGRPPGRVPPPPVAQRAGARPKPPPKPPFRAGSTAQWGAGRQKNGAERDPAPSVDLGTDREEVPLLRQYGLMHLDVDLLLLLLRFGALRQRNRQHAVTESGADVVAVDAIGKAEGALERAVGPLAHICILALLFLLLALLALDRQHVAVDGHFDVLLVHAGKLGGDLVDLVILRHVDRRNVE